MRGEVKWLRTLQGCVTSFDNTQTGSAAVPKITLLSHLDVHAFSEPIEALEPLVVTDALSEVLTAIGNSCSFSSYT